MASLQEEFEHACKRNDGQAVRRILEECTPAKRIELMSNATSMEKLVHGECNHVIPVIAHFFPETVKKPISGMTPFLFAAEHCKQVLHALARAGADIPLKETSSEVFKLILRNNLTSGTSKRDMMLSLRSLGFDLNAQSEQSSSVLSHMLRHPERTDEAFVCIDAGADFYRALGMAKPPNLFCPDFSAIEQCLINKQKSQFYDPKRTENSADRIVKRVAGILQRAPEHLLNHKDFLDNGSLNGQVPQYEALGLMDYYFALDAEKRWEGGRNEMMYTASRLPRYIVDVVKLQRETPLARTGSITAAYAGGSIEQRMP